MSCRQEAHGPDEQGEVLLCVNRERLAQFRDLKISRNELVRSTGEAFASRPLESPVQVCAEHLIRVLQAYRSGSIRMESLLAWVNTIWFSDWYEYCPQQSDSIASVMSRLEESDEPGKELDDERIDAFIRALRENVEV